MFHYTTVYLFFYGNPALFDEWDALPWAASLLATQRMGHHLSSVPEHHKHKLTSVFFCPGPHCPLALLTCASCCIHIHVCLRAVMCSCCQWILKVLRSKGWVIDSGFNRFLVSQGFMDWNNHFGILAYLLIISANNKCNLFYEPGGYFCIQN